MKLNLTKIEIMEMYEKVKQERDELKLNLDQYLLEDIKMAKKVVENSKNIKKSKSKAKISKSKDKGNKFSTSKKQKPETKLSYLNISSQSRPNFQDQSFSKIKKAFYELASQILQLDTKEKDRFK